MLIDKHNRPINYLRIAVTDKCNLRCFYCMPSEGINFVKHKELLSYEEIIRFSSISASLGVNKIRITGGEPFLRKDIMTLFRGLSEIDGIDTIAVTTNGTASKQYLNELLELGVNHFNLSLDSLNQARFLEITRRDMLSDVLEFYQQLLSAKATVRINCVVMDGRNIEDLVPLVSLAEKDKVSVRFIEEMPFNGTENYTPSITWNATKILGHIEEYFGEVEKVEDIYGATANVYKIQGFKGTFGIIPAFSRSFCGSCNRIRLTPTGTIKTCLYDDGVFNVLKMMRAGASDVEIALAIEEAVKGKYIDGFVAEKHANRFGNSSESMATIGG